VTPSRRLRQRHVEDRRVNVTGCVGPCYTIFVVFNVLGSRSIVVISPFVWANIYDPRGLGLLATSQFLFLHS
jgi:hypothetical protein